MSANDVGDCGVGGDHHGWVYPNDPENALSGNASASRTSLSLCPWKSKICPTGRVPDGPICETDSSGDGGWKSDGISRSYANDCCWMSPCA